MELPVVVTDVFHNGNQVMRDGEILNVSSGPNE